jgi:hypothetical protein
MPLPLTIVRGGNTLFTDVNKDTDPGNNAAIRALKARRAELVAEIAEIDIVIEATESRVPRQSIRHPHPPVRPGQFSGMKRSVALRMYLNERPGGVTFAKALQDLLIGGIERTKEPRDNRRYLTTAITQNPKVFDYDPDTDLITLKTEKKK